MEFLNKYIFTQHPLTQPLITMFDVHLFVAGFGIMQLVFVMLFVAEQDVKRVSFIQMIK